MDPSIAGRLARSSLRSKQAGVADVGGDGNRKPSVYSRLIELDRAATKLAPAEKESVSSQRRDPPRAARHGAIEITLPNGVRVCVEGGVDGDALHLVLSMPSEL